MREARAVTVGVVDLPRWAWVTAWDVSRWTQVLDACAGQLGDHEMYLTPNGPIWVRGSMVNVPGIGRVPVEQLAALVHRTAAPPSVRGCGGWFRMVLRLESVHVRQQRLAWRIRTAVYHIVHAEIERRRTLLEDLRPDPFQVSDPPLPPPMPAPVGRA